MADTVNVGSAPNAGDGDALRSAMQKVNNRFLQFEGNIDLNQRFQGAATTDPTTRLVGGALQDGDWFFHVGLGLYKIRRSGAWVVAPDVLAGDLAGGSGASVVGTQQPLTGARIITQAQKNAQRVHVEDFSVSSPGLQLQRAIAGTPAGGTLFLGAGPYVANFAIARNDIRIVGEGLPFANNGRTALQGGTIIQGKLELNGNNISVENIGVDCGSVVCAAMTGGTPMDGLVIHDPLQVSQRYNVSVRNVAGLCADPDALVHAVLLEGLSSVAFENVHGYQGFGGVIIKASDGYARGLYGYRNSQSGVYIKSDSYAPTMRLLLDDLQAQDEGLGMGVGVFYSANTSQMGGIVTGKIRTRGFGTGVAINSTAGGQVINDMSFGQIFCDSAANFGFVTNSTLLQTNVGHLKVTNTTSGKHVQVNDECLGLDIGLIETSSPAGKNLDDAVYLGGQFRVGRIVNTQQYNSAINPGITVSHNPVARKSWSIGSYLGRLNVNAGASGLRNGWTAAFGETPAATYRNGTVRLSGRAAVPATPWAGKEVILQVSDAIAPRAPRTLTTFAFNSATGLAFPVLLEITTTGLVSLLQMNNTAAVPATTAWVQLNDLSWDVEV